MTGLDPSTLERFAALASERLAGDWVVLGGCVLPLLGMHERVTIDIDVACVGDADQGQVVALMEIAVELGLPPEKVWTKEAGASACSWSLPARRGRECDSPVRVIERA